MRKLILTFIILAGSSSMAESTNLNELIFHATAEETAAHRELLELLPQNSEALSFQEKMAEIRIRESLKNTNFSVQLVDGR